MALNEEGKMETVKVKIVSRSGLLPAYETEGSAGMDLRAFLEAPMTIKAGGRALVPTGLFIELPPGYEAQVRARSGLAIRKGIGMPNGIGTVDSDYRGELLVPLINWGEEDFLINSGDRIAQMIISRVERAELVPVLELEDSELQRTEKAINDADLNILIGTYENYVKDVERFKIFSQSSTQKDNEVHRMEYEINKARTLLSSKRQGLGDVMIAEYQNKVGELNNDIAKVGEFMRISASMAANKNGEVSPDYTEKVKEMTELCERLSGQKNLSPAKQNEILRAQHAKLTDELSDFKKRDENKKYAEYDKEEKAFTKLKADYANAKKGRSEMAKEYSEQLSTVNYKKNFYQIELNKICDAYGIKHLGHSQSIEDHAKILTQLQNAKTKILADSHNREQEIRMQLSNIGNDMYKCAQKYGADIGGMSSFFKKRESVFQELNNVRNSGTILKDKLPEIKAREKDIYDAGIDIQIDVPTDQLKSMLDKLSVFMPDPDKKGNSKEYMAMHEAIQKAKALYESGEDISREAHIKAAKDIKEAANKYLDAKSHQIRFWPFSSNQRYARILNAQSLASAAEKMEEIANSISPIEAQYNKLMGPSGKYNVNNPKYEENLLTDIFDKAKQQKQPEKTNELEAKEQQNVMQ